MFKYPPHQNCISAKEVVMFKVILLIAILIYFIVNSIMKGMSLWTIIAYIPFAISIFAAVFAGDQGIMFIASIISGVLTYFLSHNIALTIGITFILIIHTAVFGDN